MSETEIVSIVYKNSETKEHQGTRKSIQKYLNDGFYVKESRNGYWVLVKSARVNVTLRNGELTETFNMKEDICNHYGKEKMSYTLCNNFITDVNSGKIKLTLDASGAYTFN